MKETISEKLKAQMRDDPWFSMLDPRQLDTSGFLDPALRTRAVHEDDGFEQAVEEKPTTYTDIFKVAQTDRAFVKEWADRLGKTPEERDALFKANDPERRRVFHAGDWKCSAQFAKGSWQISATDSETGEARSFRLPQIERTDSDGMMAAVSRLLNKPRHPWKEISESERTEIVRMATGGSVHDMQSAIYTWLNYAGIEDDVSGDPRYQELCDEICSTVFRAGRPELDGEAWEWMMEKAADRPLTVNLLFKLAEMWEDERKHRERGLLFGGQLTQEPEEAPTTEDLDSLSDEQIRFTLREARKIAAGSNLNV
jgi:hypothetical protein